MVHPNTFNPTCECWLLIPGSLSMRGHRRRQTCTGHGSLPTDPTHWLLVCVLPLLSLLWTSPQCET